MDALPTILLLCAVGVIIQTKTTNAVELLQEIVIFTMGVMVTMVAIGIITEIFAEPVVYHYGTCTLIASGNSNRIGPIVHDEL